MDRLSGRKKNNKNGIKTRSGRMQKKNQKLPEIAEKTPTAVGEGDAVSTLGEKK